MTIPPAFTTLEIQKADHSETNGASGSETLMVSLQNNNGTTLPTEPGFYWITEAGMNPQIVEVIVACTAHNLLQVILPGDSQRYPLDLWDNALWHGPLSRPE